MTMIEEAGRQARQDKVKKQIMLVGLIAFLISCFVVFCAVYYSYQIHQTDNLRQRLQPPAADPEPSP